MEMLPSYPIGNKETLQVSVLPTMSEPLKSAKKLFVNILSSDAPYVNRTGIHGRIQKMAGSSGVQSFHTPCMAAIGKSTISERRFPEAASTFSYIVRLYDGQTNITSEALIWLSRCYSALGWQYDAEDALNRVNNDSLPLSLAVPYASATGNYLLGSQRYKEPSLILKRQPKTRRTNSKSAMLLSLGQTLPAIATTGTSLINHTAK